MCIKYTQGLFYIEIIHPNRSTRIAKYIVSLSLHLICNYYSNLQDMQRSLLSLFIIFIFSFQNTFATDYYWVGGSGNWTDYGQHWAKTAGGNIFHTQVPGPLDNIFFNDNSLSGRTIVNLDQTIESCKDISVTITTDTLLFNSSAANPKLSIYGSTLLSPKLKVSSNIKFYFEASSGSQTFNQNRAILPCSLIFNNSGSWHITDSMNVFYIEILNGVFNASNKKICTDYFIKDANSARVNLLSCVFYVNTFSITENSDIVSGIKIYTSKLLNYYNYPQITLNGSSLVVDSIFCIKNTYVRLNGEGHVKYMRFDNTDDFSLSHSGGIDRIDATNLFNLSFSSTIGILNPSIGIFNVSNLKSVYISSRSLNINELNLTSSSDCNNLLNIYGYGDIPPKLNIQNSNAFVLDYCSIANVDASAFPLKISNAVDGGNNTGITFLSYAGAGTLYRIGDGSWSDVTKWSHTSNGPPSNCKPTVYTDVVIDAFSFTKPDNIINFDGNNTSVCKNITIANFSSALTFEGTLTCYGNFLSSTELSSINSTDIIFNSNSGSKTINFTNGSNPHQKLNLTFSGTGTYYLLSDIVCGQFNVNGSKIYTNGHNLSNTYMDLNNGNFYGSTSSITTAYFYNELFSTNDFESTKITFSGRFEINGQAGQYGTIIMNGSILSGNNSSDKIKHLKINSSGTITKSLICDSISIKKGIQLNLNHSTLVFGLFYNSGPALGCGKYTYLNLITNSVFKSKRNITFDQFILENVSAVESGFTYTANNSIDVTGNIGVVFNQPFGKTFYWVGGAGNWSDESHWSFASGGSRANCIPSRIDNVIFDANSFINPTNTISINGLYECKDFQLHDTPKVTFSGGLKIFGSFNVANDAVFTHINLLGSLATSFNASASTFESITVIKTNTTTFINNISTRSFDVVIGAIKLFDVDLHTNTFNAVFDLTDSLTIRNSNVYSGAVFDLHLKNGLAKCTAFNIELSAFNLTYEYRIISDTTVVDLGNILIKYSPFDMPKSINNPALNLAFANINIDTLTTDASFEGIVETQFYNTKVNTLNASNNILHLTKADPYYFYWNYNASDTPRPNHCLIKNAQLKSYKIGVSNIHFDHLKVYPGSTMQIRKNDTLYVNHTLDATGAPSYPIQISSSSNGSQGYIQNNGVVFGEYLFIQDNYVLNNSGYAGNYSSDITNNSGWNFGALYDTLLCSFDRLPCENDVFRLTVISDQAVTNGTWHGPNNFTSTEISPSLSNLSTADNGIYTFTSKQGACMMDITVFKSVKVNIIDNLSFTNSFTLENNVTNAVWLLNNSVISDETSNNIYPYQTGNYKAVTTSQRGCKYTSNELFYQYPLDPAFQPTLNSAEFDLIGNTTITWTDVENESWYFIYATTPNSQSFIPVGSANADELTYTFNTLSPGDYCFNVKAFIGATASESLPSNTLCKNIPNIDGGTDVKPLLTYIGLNISNDIEIRWNDVSGESDYTIYYKAANHTTYTIAGNTESNATSFVIPNTGEGECCIYIQASLINVSDISLPSEPLCINVSDPTSTGISNSKVSAGTVYPNPTNTGAVTISPFSKNSVYSIRIETLQGEKVFIKEDMIGIVQITLNLKQGVYLIKLQSDAFTLCEKLIVTQ